MSKYKWIIEEDISEWKTSIAGTYNSLEEAEKHLMEVKNWFAPNGTCQIKKINEQGEVLEIRDYYEGKLRWVEDRTNISLDNVFNLDF